MATYRTPEQRRDLVRSWTQSGLSAEQFAAARGLAKSSLLRWKSEQAPALSALATAAPRVDFVRLVARPPTAPRGLVVEIADARIRVESGFDPDLFAGVIAALRGGV